MKFKIDGNFLQVCPVPANPRIKRFDVITRHSERLCERFIEAGIIADNEDNYGLTFIEVAGNALMFDILDVLTKYLRVDSIRPETWDALCACTLIGNADCPGCGAELKYVETQGHELNDGNYWVPNSYVIDNYIYECPVCGLTIKTPNEL